MRNNNLSSILSERILLKISINSIISVPFPGGYLVFGMVTIEVLTRVPETTILSINRYIYGYNLNAIIYGRLYTWFASTDVRRICPDIWHVPSFAEWTILANYITNSGYGFQGSG
jgi:hypothetical protein